MVRWPKATQVGRLRAQKVATTSSSGGVARHDSTDRCADYNLDVCPWSAVALGQKWVSNWLPGSNSIALTPGLFLCFSVPARVWDNDALPVPLWDSRGSCLVASMVVRVTPPTRTMARTAKWQVNDHRGKGGHSCYKFSMEV